MDIPCLDIIPVHTGAGMVMPVWQDLHSDGAFKFGVEAAIKSS
jgi:hypothetical protein